jgi:signal transduction histidine kinase
MMPDLKGFSSLFFTRDDKYLNEVQRFFEKRCIYPHFRQINSIKGIEDIFKQNEWENVIFDYNNVDVDILEVIKLRDGANRHLPVIITGDGIGEDRVIELLKSGVNNFVPRSNIERLLDVIHREAELREKNRLLERYKNIREFSRRYEMIRRFTGSISHFLNNMLMVIMNSSIFLKDDRGLLPHLKEDVEQIYNAAKRGQDFVKNLLIMAGGVQLETKILDLNTFLYRAAERMRSIMGSNIDVNVMRLPKQVEIRGDENLLIMAFSRIAENTKYFAPKGGTFQIKAEVVEFDAQDEFVEASGIKPGEYIKLTFTDNGVGIVEEDRAHIFEPFFSTKDSKMAGLGLSILYGVVWEHNGTVDVESEEGKGTSIIVYLPVYKRDSKEIPALRVSEYAPKKKGFVLIVDDDNDVKNILMRIFVEEGYSVSTAVDGLGALVLLDKIKPKDFVALVTDVIMPNMDGVELAREVREKYGDIKVVFISGYPDSQQEVLKFENSIFIQKPINRQELMKRVREFISEEDPENNLT